MKAIAHSVVILLEVSYIFCSPVIIQYKCWLWDSACLTAKAQGLVPALAAGIPSIGIERLDTMFIDGLHVDQDGFQTDWRNIYLNGLANTVIDKFSIDMNSKVMRLVFHSDLSLKAHYVASGYLISLPISGQGELTMKLGNVQMEFVIPFEITKDILGRDIINLKGYQYWHDVKNGATMFLDNLYYGNNALSQQMHTLLHQNWKQLTTKFGRYLFDKSNDKIFNAMRTYFQSQPLDTISFH